MTDIRNPIMVYFSETDVEYYNNVQEAADDLLIDAKTIISKATIKNKIEWPRFIWGKHNMRGRHPNKSAKPILQIDKSNNIVAEYGSEYQAYFKTGIGNISKCLNGKLKTAGGFIWKYKE